VSLRAYPQVNLGPASYWHVNRMWISCNTDCYGRTRWRDGAYARVVGLTTTRNGIRSPGKWLPVFGPAFAFRVLIPIRRSLRRLSQRSRSRRSPTSAP